MRLVVLVASVVVVIVAAVAGVATLRNGDGDVISSPGSTVPAAVGSSSSILESTTPTTTPGAAEPVMSTTTPAAVLTSTTATVPTTTPTTTTTTTTTTVPPSTTTTTTAPVIDIVACQNDSQNYRLAYPATWSAELDDPVWGCGLFDPDPFELTPNTDLPAVAVVIDLLPGVYEEYRQVVVEPAGDNVLGEPEFRFIGGRLAVCAFAEAGDSSYFDAGIVRLSCLAEWGADSLLIDAIAWPWLDSGEVFAVAEAMLDTIEPITPIPFRD